MKDFLIEMAFSNGVSALLLALQDGGRRKKSKPAFLKVFRVIWAAFGEDEDFKAVVGQ